MVSHLLARSTKVSLGVCVEVKQVKVFSTRNAERDVFESKVTSD